MKALPLLVLIAIMLAVPAPEHQLRAKIQANHATSLRISLAYRFRFGKWFDLGFQASIAGGRAR